MARGQFLRALGQISRRYTGMPPWPNPSGSCAVRYDVDASGEGEGHHQRRAGEKSGAYLRVDAGFEIAVAGEHRAGHQILVDDGLFQFRVQRPGSCRRRWCMAVADDVEAQPVQQIALQARGFEIPAPPPVSPARAMT